MPDRKQVPEGARQALLNPAEFFQKVRNLDVELPQSGWSDHAPINYACKIWNALGERGA